MESAKIYTHLVTIVIVIIVIKGFRLKGCFRGHSIYNNKYIYLLLYILWGIFHPKCLMTFMTMTIMTTSVPKIKNGMYIDFVEIFSKKIRKPQWECCTFADGKRWKSCAAADAQIFFRRREFQSIIRSALVTLLQRRQPTKRIINYQLTTWLTLKHNRHL